MAVDAEQYSDIKVRTKVTEMILYRQALWAEHWSNGKVLKKSGTKMMDA